MVVDVGFQGCKLHKEHSLQSKSPETLKAVWCARREMGIYMYMYISMGGGHTSEME